MTYISNNWSADNTPPPREERVIKPRLSRARVAGNASVGVSMIKRVMRRIGTATKPSNAYKSMAGRGAGVRKARTFSQRVVIKTRVVQTNASGASGIKTHVNYVAREGVGIDGKEAVPLDENGVMTNAELDKFAERGNNCRHQFRIIVSPENGSHLDMEEFAKEVMNVMESDLKTRLDYVAVVHYDTDQPHVHVVINGKDDAGGDLVISRDYIGHGMRERASEIATRQLGMRSELEIQSAIDKEVTAHRMTGVDHQIIKMSESNPDGQVDLTMPPPSGNNFMIRARNQKLARLNELERLGLADEVRPGVWRIDNDLQGRLRAIGANTEIVNKVRSHMKGGEITPIVLMNKDDMSQSPVTGKVIGKGLVNELYDTKYVVVSGEDGRTYYSALSRYSEQGGMEARPGDVITIGSHKEPASGAADRNVVELSKNNGGVYDSEKHRAAKLVGARSDFDVGHYIESHTKRMNALTSRGLVVKISDSQWKIPSDLIDQINAHPALNRGNQSFIQVERHSALSLEQQVDANGFTWLDSRIASGGYSKIVMQPIKSPFQKELQAAMESRFRKLSDMGLVSLQVDGTVRLAPDIATKLVRMELREAVARLSNRYGAHVDLDATRKFAGQFVAVEQLASGPHAVVQNGDQFAVVPIKSRQARQLGRALSVSLERGHSLHDMDLNMQRRGLRIAVMGDLSRSKALGVNLGMGR